MSRDFFAHALFFPAYYRFADIAGFTNWSSKRDPPQVFQLLEALYGVFDKQAKKRSVFKVETIGDCYGTFMYNQRDMKRFVCTPSLTIFFISFVTV